MEMKPKVALFVATKLYMNMTEFPGAAVQTPVPHWITLNPSIAKGDSVSIIRRCRASLQHPKEGASLTMKVVEQCGHHKPSLSQAQASYCTSLSSYKCHFRSFIIFFFALIVSFPLHYILLFR